MARALLILPLLAGCDLYFAPSNDSVDGGSMALPDAALTGCTPPPCQPTQDGATVCGQIVDIANGRPVTDPSVLLAVRYADGTPASVADLRYDSCGYFEARGIHGGDMQQVLRFEVGDQQHHYDGTVQALPYALQNGGLVNAITLRALRKVTDDAWTQAAGQTYSFASQGATLYTFRRFGAPVAGVRLDTPEVYTFADTDPTLRNILERGNTTDADGSLLVAGTGGNLVPSGGVEPACQWPTVTLGAGGNLLWVIDVDATCQV